jgi:cellobiose phosphorylase
MDSVRRELVRRNDKLICLLTPPFDKGPQEPGYIKGYLPGIRENGGQYTHGSTWLIAALALDDFKDEAFELFNAMNPVTHTETQKKIDTYKMEPYVTCGDVYSHDQHAGRGGWSWYTGSSGWMFQVGIKYILGIQATATGLKITPRVPLNWNNFSVSGKLRGKSFIIEANKNSSGNKKLTLNEKTYQDLIPWDDFTNTENFIKVEY